MCCTAEKQSIQGIEEKNHNAFQVFIESHYQTISLKVK